MKLRFGLLATSLLIASSAAHADSLTVSPRTWLVIDNIANGNEASSNSAGVSASVTAPPFVVLMVGGALSYRSNSFAPKTTFTATALFGSDNETLTVRGGEVRRSLPGPNDTTVDQVIFNTEITLCHCRCVVSERNHYGPAGEIDPSKLSVNWNGLHLRR